MLIQVLLVLFTLQLGSWRSYLRSDDRVRQDCSL